MPKIQCLECPHMIFYSAKGGVLRCVKCETEYEWVGDVIKAKDIDISAKREEQKKRIEAAKETGDYSDLSAFDIQTLSIEIILTTGFNVANRNIEIELEIISAECVYGLHLFKDIFAGIRDVFGGRSRALQDALRDARRTVLTELRREALTINANAVIGVDLDYQEISGGGKNMLMLVASGTAVKLK